MSLPSRNQKHYSSAHKRLFEAALAHFFEEHFPKLFGPVMRARIAQELLALIERHCLPASHLRTGQCLWNAVSIDTRADSTRLRLVPVILTLVNEADVAQFRAGPPSPRSDSRPSRGCWRKPIGKADSSPCGMRACSPGSGRAP